MVISEAVFRERLIARLSPLRGAVKGVGGPGRSGALAAVYASHFLGVPYLPEGRDVPPALRPFLVVDAARKTGATIRKAARRTDAEYWIALFDEPPRVRFWYEVFGDL